MEHQYSGKESSNMGTTIRERLESFKKEMKDIWALGIEVADEETCNQARQALVGIDIAINSLDKDPDGRQDFYGNGTTTIDINNAHALVRYFRHRTHGSGIIPEALLSQDRAWMLNELYITDKDKQDKLLKLTQLFYR